MSPECHPTDADGNLTVSASGNKCTKCGQGFGRHLTVDANGFLKVASHRYEADSGTDDDDEDEDAED